MKNYKTYGNDKLHIELREDAKKALAENDPFELREYEYLVEDSDGDIVTDEYGNPVYGYEYSIRGAIDEDHMTDTEVNELLEEIYRNSHSFDLIICYKNGETDRYYTRTSGNMWVTETEADDVLEEMMIEDPETFKAIVENENVEWVFVADGHGTRYDGVNRNCIREYMNNRGI